MYLGAEIREFGSDAEKNQALVKNRAEGSVGLETPVRSHRCQVNGYTLMILKEFFDETVKI